jgi:hypothetical protein
LYFIHEDDFLGNFSKKFKDAVLSEVKQPSHPDIIGIYDQLRSIFKNKQRIILQVRSSQVSSKFVVYKFVVFSEVLAHNCALVFLENHQLTQHGCHSLFVYSEIRALKL